MKPFNSVTHDLRSITTTSHARVLIYSPFSKVFTLLAICLLAFCNGSLADEYKRAIDSKIKTITAEVYKLESEDADQLVKVAISFHHALLEVNYQEGYIVAAFSNEDLARLHQKNLFPVSWPQWFGKLQSAQKSVFASQAPSSQVLKSIDIQDSIPNFSCYSTVEDAEQQMQTMLANYPNHVEIIDIGDSWAKQNTGQGKDLLVIKITNKNISEAKPKLFLQSGLHAREYTPVQLAIDFADTLLSGKDSNGDLRMLVDHYETHLLLNANPDSRKIAESGALVRKNANANHCPDQQLGKGVDLNRNFAQNWNSTQEGSSGNPCSLVYRGSSAESEPETIAISNYIRGLFPDRRGTNDSDAAPEDTQGLHIDLHSFSELILWPWGHTELPSANQAAYERLGNKLAFFNNYRATQSTGLYITDGTSDGPSYGELGVAAITFELGTSFFETCNEYVNKIRPENLLALIYALKISRAPYQLPFGPEVVSIEGNGSENKVSVKEGSNLDILFTTQGARTKLPAGAADAVRVEFSVNTPIWDDQATRQEATVDASLTEAGSIFFRSTIDSSVLTAGENILYSRSINSRGEQGAPSAFLIEVGQNNAPVPNFTFSCSELTCDFDASASTDPDGDSISFSWEFPNGQSKTGNRVTHIFANQGTKVVTLNATDAEGSVATKVENITVTLPPDTTPNTSSGGGGGKTSLLSLLLLSFLIVATPAALNGNKKRSFTKRF